MKRCSLNVFKLMTTCLVISCFSQFSVCLYEVQGSNSVKKVKLALRVTETQFNF